MTYVDNKGFQPKIATCVMQNVQITLTFSVSIYIYPSYVLL